MTPPNSNATTTIRIPRSEQDLETRMAKALAHPLRAKVLSRLNEGVASPNELSRELDEPLGNVSYHVKALLELGCIELVDTAQRRGAIEHYYRALTRARLDETQFKKLPASIRGELSAQIVSDAIADVAKAFKAGTFDARTDRHSSWTKLALDEQGWKDLQAELGKVLDRGLEIQAESAGRLQDGQSGGEPVQATMVLLGYEAAPAS
ncbi:MAG TPA: helix-turn-helix domain-containing protein [Capillimicrobium sp.]|nr:helix-turn-helix domain-containing protein [Capillimicrobium sp.]